MQEGFESKFHCVTGSIFYPQNETEVEWYIISRDERNYTLPKKQTIKRPTALQPNESFLKVATYTVNATKKHNGMRVKCRLYFKGELQVESDLQNLTVYCMWRKFFWKYYMYTNIDWRSNLCSVQIGLNLGIFLVQIIKLVIGITLLLLEQCLANLFLLGIWM